MGCKLWRYIRETKNQNQALLNFKIVKLVLKKLTLLYLNLRMVKVDQWTPLFPNYLKCVIINKHLCYVESKLFNYILDNNIYPEIWRRGIIVPVPKKGNLNATK